MDGSNELLMHGFADALHEASGILVSDIRFGSAKGDAEPDASAVLQTPDGQWQLIFFIRKTFYPRDAREALWKLEGHRTRAQHPSQIVPMVLAEHLSKGAKEALKQRGVGFFDSAGALFLKHRNWLINIEGSKPKARAAPREVALFRGAREMVVHALLQSRGDWFHGLDIVELSSTSGYSVSTVLQALERLEWVESQGQGRHRLRRLSRPGELLDAWARDWAQRKQDKTRWYFFCEDPRQLADKLGARMAASKSPLAFTGAIAANRLSPLLTHVDVAELVAPRDVREMAEAIGLKPAEKGANVVLIERAGATQLFQDYSPTQRTWSTSPFIQYLDLLDGRGRNAELAAQLRSEILMI
ncbi:type IV toxin-antitoxin system AbiEi family antitoxin [Pseudomonas putida]|uniref:Transcriptional regulator, AbiEi antitoxin, Type IV TA system n=1 Tax=Pseudomonas putida TaxID=303 RepID=A0A1Q9QY26_PSEPU|nr:type IV toxin-antitoxin system AbiEi family antitoxin [Pseudomonas putida]OLS60051.1 hypothetical protein PSEMO_53600 [Pseudomonas putida]